MAKKEAVKKPPTPKVVSKIIRTADVRGYKDADGVIISCVSEKLQRAGVSVYCVAGGIIGDRKVHYFNISLKQAEELKNKNKTNVLSKDDLELIEEVESVTPSKVIETGLKEALNNPSGAPKPPAISGGGATEEDIDAGSI